MKKIISLVALFVATSASAQYQEVLKDYEGFRFVPSEFTSNNKTIAYGEKDGEFIIYDENFKETTVIKPNAPSRVSGSCQAEAVVSEVKAKLQSSYRNGRYTYYDPETWQNKELQATSLEDMVAKLSEHNSNYTYVAFTDLNGLPACYGYDKNFGTSSYNFYMYDTFKTTYPTSYYTLEDGYIYNRSASYSIDIDTSKAQWKEIPGTRNNDSYNYGAKKFDYENVDAQSTLDHNFALTQTLFNDDDNWEYVTEEYGEPVLTVSTYTTPTIKANGDGTFTLTTSASIQSEVKSLQVKNDKGNIVMTLPAGRVDVVLKINNKYYLEINDPKNNNTLLLLNKKATSSPSKGIRGDVNGDGVVNMTDANEVVNMYLGK